MLPAMLIPRIQTCKLEKSPMAGRDVLRNSDPIYQTISHKMEEEAKVKKEELIKTVRERLGDKLKSPKRHDDKCIARFLTATNNNVDQTVKNMEDWLVRTFF